MASTTDASSRATEVEHLPQVLASGAAQHGILHCIEHAVHFRLLEPLQLEDLLEVDHRAAAALGLLFAHLLNRRLK